jgi:hypothetical protein
MQDRAKGKGQTKCSFWSSMLGFGRGITNHNPEKNVLLRNPKEEAKTDRGL